MRGHLPARDDGGMDPAPALYVIRINGHLGATGLSAFPAMAPHHHGAHTVLTGLLDRSALYGVLAEIEAPPSASRWRARPSTSPPAGTANPPRPRRPSITWTTSSQQEVLAIAEKWRPAAGWRPFELQGAPPAPSHP
jgi:hypothetical protein